MSSEVILEVKNLKNLSHFMVVYCIVKSQKLKPLATLASLCEKEKLLELLEKVVGKSTLAKTILRLYEPDSGEVIFQGKNIFSLNPQEMLNMRKKIQMIFKTLTLA